MTTDNTTEEHSILVTKGQTLVYAQPQLVKTEEIGALLTLGHNIAATNKEEVPESAQEDVIQQHHDGPLHRHPG